MVFITRWSEGWTMLSCLSNFISLHFCNAELHVLVRTYHTLLFLLAFGNAKHFSWNIHFHFLGYACSMQKFQGLRLNPSHSSDPTHAVTTPDPYATRELLHIFILSGSSLLLLSNSSQECSLQEGTGKEKKMAVLCEKYGLEWDVVLQSAGLGGNE